jgi:hypothetical protein
MPTKQFVEKQIFKETSKEFSKEKLEKEKLEKESKEHKEKAEKEKHEKETKEHKDFHKEVHKEIAKEAVKIELLEVQRQTETPAAAPSEATQELSEPSLTKNPDKYISEKYFVEKIHPEKIYKAEYEKHYKIEKVEYEYVAGPVATDPGGPVEQRLAALEAAVGQLQHFIPQELRPDLSKGALKQEPAETATDEEKK